MIKMQEMAFPFFKFQNFLGEYTPRPPPPIHVWYIGHTRGLQPLLSPSNILSHRKVPFQKMPPTGKSLKKALSLRCDNTSENGVPKRYGQRCTDRCSSRRYVRKAIWIACSVNNSLRLASRPRSIYQHSCHSKVNCKCG